MSDGELNDAVIALREWGAARAAFWANPTRGQCEWAEGCPEDNPIIQPQEDYDGKMLCAHHARQVADRHKPYPCDRCGQGSAFRDPVHRRDEMLCAACHLEDGYEPTERAMVKKLENRQGVEHPMARRVKCIAADKGTECVGEVKQRGRLGVLCNKHADPKKFNASRA